MEVHSWNEVSVCLLSHLCERVSRLNPQYAKVSSFILIVTIGIGNTWDLLAALNGQ